MYKYIYVYIHVYNIYIYMPILSYECMYLNKNGK
jgi:hypothetical protein